MTYTIFARRKSDGRWSWIGTKSDTLEEEEGGTPLELTDVIVKLPKNFLFGATVHAKRWDAGGEEWFFVESSRNAVVR